MNSAQPKSTKKISLKRIAIGVVAVLAIVVLVIGLGFFWLTHNNASDEAKPLEAALTAAGASKQCSTGDAGHGPDNYNPWYDAIYSVPGNSETAAATVRNAAQKAGLNLADKTDPNPYFNEAYLGAATKSHGKGAATYSILVYKTWTFVSPDDKVYCTITKQANPSPNVTTVRINVALSEFKK